MTTPALEEPGAPGPIRKPGRALPGQAGFRHGRVGFHVACSALALVCAALPVSTASAAISACFGAPGVGLCAVEGNCTVDRKIVLAPAAVIDCGANDLRIAGPAGELVTEESSFTLRARNLSVEAGARIVAGASRTVATGFGLELTGLADIRGRLLARRGALVSSVIRISATDGIVIKGLGRVIDLRGRGANRDGGELELESAGNIVIRAFVDVSGRTGQARSNETSGGTVFARAGGDILVAGEMRANGQSLEGGLMQFFAGGSFTLSAPAGRFTLEGSGDYGWGGAVDVKAASIVWDGETSLRGGVNVGGGYGAGGELLLYASSCGGITITGPIVATGGEDWGGFVEAESRGPVRLFGRVDVSATKFAGEGGYVFAYSGALLQVGPNASILANGNMGRTTATRAAGGIIDMQGCSLDLGGEASSGALLSATGNRGGDILLRAIKTLTPGSAASIHVAATSTVDTSGSIAPGRATIEVETVRTGTCSDNGTACTLNPDCSPGATCDGANPDTGGTLRQFSVPPVVTQRSPLRLCSACP